MSHQQIPVWIARVLIALAVVLVYQMVLENGFHFDDEPHIVYHEPTHADEVSWATLKRAWVENSHPRRPLASVTFAVDWARGTGSSRPFQWTNVLIHLIASLFVFEVIRLVLGRVGIISTSVDTSRDDHLRVTVAAGLASLVWSLHPIQVQAVTYIVQRMASLAALGTIACVVLWVFGRRSPNRRWFLVLAAAAALIGALSKEIAYVIPAVLVLAEVALVRPADVRIGSSPVDRVIAWLGGGVSLAGLLLLVLKLEPFATWVWAGYEARTFTIAERLLTQPRIIFYHLGQIVAPSPTRFSIEHVMESSTGLFDPPTTFLALAAVAVWIGIGLLAFWLPDFRPVGFCMLWLPVTMVIEFTFIPLEMIFEHRMYLPSVGLAALMGLLMLRLFSGNRTRATVALVAVIVFLGWCIITTVHLIPVWRTSVSLYEHATVVTPESSRSWINLCSAYIQEKRLGEAEVACREGLKLDPKSAKGLLNMGSIALQQGDPARAVKLMEAGAAIGGTLPRVNYWLGMAYRDLGDYRRAAQHLAAEMDRSPYDVGVRINLGNCLHMRGDLEGALAAWTEARSLQPDHPELLYNMGQTLIKLGRADEARLYLERFVWVAGEQFAAQKKQVERFLGKSLR